MKVAMRAYYSSYHLWAARRFAVEAETREAELLDAAPVFDISQRALVTACVISSVAFLEAAINEVLKDAADEHHSYVGTMNPASLEGLSQLWQRSEGNGERLSTLEKFQEALRACEHHEFDEGRRPFQDVAILIRLRDHLQHFKPRTATAENLVKFERQLMGKFDLNRLIPEDMGNPFFPDKCLGSGCAAWAVDSAMSFADDFFARLGIEPNYQRVDFSPVAIPRQESDHGRVDRFFKFLRALFNRDED